MLKKVTGLASLLVVGFGLAGAAFADAAKPATDIWSESNRYFEQHLAGPPVVVDGQHLHPKYQYYLEERARNAKGVTAEAKRAEQAKRLQQADVALRMRASLDRDWPLRTKTTRKMRRVEDRLIAGPQGSVPVRIYSPETDETAPLPVLVYFHGGGWLFGSVAAVDPAVRLIANKAQVIVVSVDYRLAPQYKFPAAYDDAFAAYDWVAANAASFGGDPARIAVGGDSAGGAMSIAIAYKRVQDGKKPPVAQLLYYPVVDMRDNGYKSYDLFRTGYGLDMPFMTIMADLVFKTPQARQNLYVSPILAKSFAGMPPAIIATAGFDPLRDHGRAYAERLVKEGVEVHFTNYASLIHGFMQFSGVIDDAFAACAESAETLGRVMRQERYKPKK